MNLIRKGRIVSFISTVILIFGIVISKCVEEVYKENAIRNLQGVDKISYELGAYKPEIPAIAVTILLGAFIIFFIGQIIASCMCMCPRCGHHLMTRHGGIPLHCPMCGQKIEY